MSKTEERTPREQVNRVFGSRLQHEGMTGYAGNDPWASLLTQCVETEPAHVGHNWLEDFRDAVRKQPQPFQVLINVEANQDYGNRLECLETEVRSIKDLVAKRMRPLRSVKARFESLLSLWKTQRRHLSFIEKMAMCPAYQQIIGMGHDAIPLLLAEFTKKPGHYDWALRSITGADPVPEESRGKLKEIAVAWIQWGRDNGYEQ